MAYLSSLTESYFANRNKGDPRYALSSMSLATEMHKTLTNAQPGSEWYNLNVWLQEYSTDGFHCTDPARCTEIKLQLNDLLAHTIYDADIIVCTVSAAAKVNMATNF